MKQRTKEEWKQAGVDIGDDVDLSRIASDVRIYSGCRIQGGETSVGPGCIIGQEAPATIENCQLGRRVELKGGFFSRAVFFDGAMMGSGAHVRAGTILEEEASGAHSVGLKQTIFMPFVTAGSLINFCDALMAGGTSRKDHSEIGSSYVHFNFTPHQDKATASLLGDVPRGVFLDQKPIFLGGQGGLVGPARIAYGSVVAAGGVCRQDLVDEQQLHIPPRPEALTRTYQTGVYSRSDRMIRNNLIYIGNMMALREWYRQVRVLFVRDAFDQSVLSGGLANLERILNERIKRLDDVAEKMEYSVSMLQTEGGKPEEIEVQKRFMAEWAVIKKNLAEITCKPQTLFAEPPDPENGYLQTIQLLNNSVRETGRTWLQALVNDVEKLWN